MEKKHTLTFLVVYRIYSITTGRNRQLSDTKTHNIIAKCTNFYDKNIWLSKRKKNVFFTKKEKKN